MASFWLLKLLLKCIDFLSWPVLALGYPLCASVHAIENDSPSDTRCLISYWILLSLIYLFEYAFLQLLQWFQYWHYMKLMIIVYLLIPDFGRASYVYNQLVQSCIYMNPHVVISRFRNWKKIFVKKEDFIMLAEKYIAENGTEALEKLIANKNTEQSLDAKTKIAVRTTEKNEMQQRNTTQNLDAETIKTIPTTEKDEIQQTNKARLHREQKDIKDLEMIEKEEIPEGKQANTAFWSLKSNKNTSSAIAKTERMAATDTQGEASPQISAPKIVQKEWTCALCQLTITSEADLSSHLQGRKHKAACEALKAKNQLFAVKIFMKKNDKASGEPEKIISTSNALEQKIISSPHPKVELKNVENVNVQKYYYRPKTTIDHENKSQGVHVNQGARIAEER